MLSVNRNATSSYDHTHAVSSTYEPPLRTSRKRTSSTASTMASPTQTSIEIGRNRPKTVAGLRDMMHDWSEQEEKMRERFPRRNDNNPRRTNDNRANNSQRDYSGSSRKRKPDDLVAAVDRPLRGRKTTTQEQFEKLLQKKCPWHPGANHAAIDCFNLRRTFSNPSNNKKNKSTDKEPEEDDQGDKSHNAKFQDASKTINVIFGGDKEFSSRREQKLLLRKSCPSSRRYHDHSDGRRSPSRSHETISGPASRSPANSPWSWT
jgi:hypothetical protein